MQLHARLLRTTSSIAETFADNHLFQIDTGDKICQWDGLYSVYATFQTKLTSKSKIHFHSVEKPGKPFGVKCYPPKHTFSVGGASLPMNITQFIYQNNAAIYH